MGATGTFFTFFPLQKSKRQLLLCVCVCFLTENRILRAQISWLLKIPISFEIRYFCQNL